jgi:hypothetical protein
MGAPFARLQIDPFRIPDPDVGAGRSTICGVTNDPTVRGFLLAPDGDGGSGGGGAFTAEQQAKVDEIVKREKASEKAKAEKQINELTAKLKELEPLAAKISEFEAKFADVEKEKAAAAEEAAMKGKTELEKKDIALSKLQTSIKEWEAKFAKAEADFKAQVESMNAQTITREKRRIATELLSSGAAEGMAKHAVREFLAEGDVELNEKFEPVKFTYDGRPFEKAADLVSEFYKLNKGMALPPEGGNGTPRGGNRTAGGPDHKNGTAAEFFDAGLKSAPATPLPGAAALTAVLRG